MTILINELWFCSPQNATVIHFPLKSICFLLPLTRDQPTPKNLLRNLQGVRLFFSNFLIHNLILFLSICYVTKYVSTSCATKRRVTNINVLGSCLQQNMSNLTPKDYFCFMHCSFVRRQVYASHVVLRTRTTWFPCVTVNTRYSLQSRTLSFRSISSTENFVRLKFSGQKWAVVKISEKSSNIRLLFRLQFILVLFPGTVSITLFGDRHGDHLYIGFTQQSLAQRTSTSLDFVRTKYIYFPSILSALPSFPLTSYCSLLQIFHLRPTLPLFGLSWSDR